jgi:Rod binding domain-containing protein
MSPIAPVSAAPTQAAEPRKPEDPRSTAHVAKDFEAVFIHQLLQSAHALGKTDGSGYAGMALDALANGIAEGGGLGLAKAIQKVLDTARAEAQPVAGQNPISSKAP